MTIRKAPTRLLLAGLLLAAACQQQSGKEPPSRAADDTFRDESLDSLSEAMDVGDSLSLTQQPDSVDWLPREDTIP